MSRLAGGQFLKFAASETWPTHSERDRDLAFPCARSGELASCVACSTEGASTPLNGAVVVAARIWLRRLVIEAMKAAMLEIAFAYEAQPLTYDAWVSFSDAVATTMVISPSLRKCCRH